MISIKNVILPNKPLSNFDLEDAARKLKIPYFRGVFLLDALPRKPNKKECGIVNFDKSGGPGTHWVAWYKNGKTKIYFDSYGVQPPLEVIKYLERPIHYNTDQLQPAGEVFAGICVYTFLKNLVRATNSKIFSINFFDIYKTMPVDKFGRMSDAKTKDTGVSLTYINNNYIRRDGDTPVSGSINMNGNTLYNVSDPVNPQDVATKKYADKVGGGDTAIVKTRYGTYGSKGNIDMRGYTLMNVLDPADSQDVATKKYVDAANRAFIFDNNKYLAVGEVSMGGKRLENVGTPLEKFQATNKFYVDTLVEAATAGDKALRKIQTEFLRRMVK